MNLPLGDSLIGDAIMVGSTPKYDPIKAFEGWLADSPSPINFFNVLQFFNKFDDHIQLRQFILYHKGDFTPVIYRMSRISKIEFVTYNSKSWLFTARSIPKDQGNDIEGILAIVPGKFPNMFRVVTVSKSLFWSNIVRKLVKRSYPEAMPVFFKQNEIREALKNLENNVEDKLRIRILDATLKAKRDTRQIQGKSKFNTDRVWRDLSIDEMFEEATEKNQWFTSLTFAIQKAIGKQEQSYHTIATGRIGKFGEIFSNFYFNSIEEHVISTLESYASDRLELYQKRGIREREYRPSPPLEILFSFNIFDDIEEIRRFGRTMAKYPDSSIAVFHGNPYYHANIADYDDGSSFDVWILSPNRVLIAPQARSTPQGLERIISYVFYEFREGAVREYVE
jgi:hypothetical protein